MTSVHKKSALQKVLLKLLLSQVRLLSPFLGKGLDLFATSLVGLRHILELRTRIRNGEELSSTARVLRFFADMLLMTTAVLSILLCTSYGYCMARARNSAGIHRGSDGSRRNGLLECKCMRGCDGGPSRVKGCLMFVPATHLKLQLSMSVRLYLFP